MEVVAALLFLTIAGERLAEWLLKPFTERIPWPVGWGDYAEMLICAIPGFAFVLMASIDIFAFLGINFSPPMAGVIVTAIFAGGGSNLVHVLVNRVETETLAMRLDYWKNYDK